MNKDPDSYLEISGAKGLAIFVGAGISNNSGMPLANELKEYMLEKLPINRNEILQIMASPLPFEAFMQIIADNVGISKILDIFSNGEPNTNHILMARLAKNGLLKTILTTNFDLLIENAFQKEGLEEGIDFDRYYREEDFSKENFDRADDKVKILKIHGSVDDRDSIRITLRVVASKTLSDKRMNAIRYLFSAGNHEKVLILGYSCSDEFDITPQIENIRENQKEIVFVEHFHEAREEGDKIKNNRNDLFRGFPIKKIRCNTDEFIKNLWHSLKQILGEYENIESKLNWRTYINDWDDELREDKSIRKYLLAGSVFLEISDFSKAIRSCKRSLEIARGMGCLEVESDCYARLGIAHERLGDPKKAIEFHKKSLGVCKGLKYKTGESRSYVNIGTAYMTLGDFKEAIKFYEKSLEISKEIGDKVVESSSYASIGAAYSSLGSFKEAIKLHEKSLEISKEIGDKVVESSCYTNIGAAHYGLRDFKTAIEYYEKSLDICRKIGNKAEESNCYINMGTAYGIWGDSKKAMEFYEKSLEISKETGDKTGLLRSYSGLGVTYNDLEDPERAITCHKKSLEISKEIGAKMEEASCYTNLAISYGYLRDLKKAIELFLKAKKIFKETGQKHYYKTLYKNLFIAYILLILEKTSKNIKRWIKVE